MSQSRSEGAENQRLYINQSDRDALAANPAIGEERAQAIIEARPFSTWSELKRAGVDQELINQLRSEGAELGAPSAGPILEPGSGGHPGRPGGNIGRA
jgi:DNA uptake protein ComE-like DNA-binding protein